MLNFFWKDEKGTCNIVGCCCSNALLLPLFFSFLFFKKKKKKFSTRLPPTPSFSFSFCPKPLISHFNFSLFCLLSDLLLLLFCFNFFSLCYKFKIKNSDAEDAAEVNPPKKIIKHHLLIFTSLSLSLSLSLYKHMYHEFFATWVAFTNNFIM